MKWFYRIAGLVAVWLVWQLVAANVATAIEAYGLGSARGAMFALGGGFGWFACSYLAHFRKLPTGDSER